MIIGVAVWPLLLAELARSVGLDVVADRLLSIDIQTQYLLSTPVAIVILAVVAARDARRSGRPSVLLIMIAVLLAIRELYTLLGVLGTTPGAFVAATTGAVVLLVVQAVRRTLGVDRAVALASVFALSGLYAYRNAITEPLTAALALTGGTVGLMVGVVWRMLTENTFGYGDSVRFPRPSRVLLIMANLLLGASGVALLSLQGGISDTSLLLFEQLGDSQLGFTLIVTVLLVQLLAAMAPPQPSQPFSVASRTASARDAAPSLPIAEDR